MKSPLIAPVHFSGGEGHFISTEKDNLLREKIYEDKPDYVSQLVLSAKDFHNRKQYSLAIIQCSIAFEYFVCNAISPLTSRNKIKKQTKKPDCGCHVGISQLCETGLKELFGIDFGQSEIYQSLSRDVLRQRNLIVHGEMNVELTDGGTLAAISVTESAIVWLSEKFDSLL
jgi:hypothetical protein